MRKICIVLFLLFTASIIVGCGAANYTMTADEYGNEYANGFLSPEKRGEISKKYNDKTVQLTGQVIDKGNLGSTMLYLTIYSNQTRTISVIAEFPLDERQTINSLKTGDVVVVRGSCSGVRMQSNGMFVTVGDSKLIK